MMLQKANQLQRQKIKTLLYLDKPASTYRIRNPTQCPNCGLSASGIPSIVKKFGLRNMGDGTIRVQSWCKACRRPPRKYQL